MTIDPARIATRPASGADADFVSALAEICMRQYVEQVGEEWDSLLTRSRFAERWRNYQITCVDGITAGCMDAEDDGEFFRLFTIYLLPRFQNLGVGTHLLKGLMARAEEAGKPMRLRVIRLNPAIRLYQRLGFVVSETVPNRYLMIRPVGQP